ncbi:MULTISPECIES: glycosyltransferase family 4 protein [unclassified Thermosipho (in: thermotogales)]|uniref:glycosyltransferase family 4 protein n=1 Tax=unclassified Thermosipho (in: thermotogales) TaxID=2676525 RepID=UPI000985D831|nr:MULTISPECIES: glycosyltransferase family 4 protein [unclassified Thermosipho (in: thermotogales)]MBT1247681.1 hypothetical protein [Thermosipho sp. 1244]OOC46738.1 hypothetical protein XO09_05005 [Thermosipho sp. 1223]
MNILILNHYASIPEFSGAETRHFELAKRLKNHNVTIAVGSYSHLLKKDWYTLKGGDFSKEGVSFKVIKTRKYKGNGVERFLSSYDYYQNGLKRLSSEKYDVIIASSPHPFSWKLGYVLSKKFNAKFFVEIRDVWPDDLISSGLISKKHPISILFRYMAKKYYKKADGIISLVPFINEHIRNLKINKKVPIEIIPNGTSVYLFENPKKCKEVDKLFSNIKEHTIKIVYTGSHGPSNNLEFVIKCIKKLEKDIKKKFSFIFVGSGSEKSKLIKLAGKEKNIHFFEPIPKKCIPYLLKTKSDILLFSLKSFDNIKYPAYSSNKLLDYMASGKPILSVNQENLFLKQSGGAIFFDNCESFKSALKNFENYNLKAFGKQNIEYIKKYRDWDVLANRFEKFLTGG